MTFCDPPDLISARRLIEIAAILARGVLPAELDDMPKYEASGV